MGRRELAAPNGAPSKTDCGWECGIGIFKALASSSVAGLSQYDLKPGCIASNAANVSSANLATDSALFIGAIQWGVIRITCDFVRNIRNCLRQIVILIVPICKLRLDAAKYSL